MKYLTRQLLDTTGNREIIFQLPKKVQFIEDIQVRYIDEKNCIKTENNLECELICKDGKMFAYINIPESINLIKQVSLYYSIDIKDEEKL